MRHLRVKSELSSLLCLLCEIPGMYWEPRSHHATSMANTFGLIVHHTPVCKYDHPRDRRSNPSRLNNLNAPPSSEKRTIFPTLSALRNTRNVLGASITPRNQHGQYFWADCPSYPGV